MQIKTLKNLQVAAMECHFKLIGRNTKFYKLKNYSSMAEYLFEAP